MSLGFAEDGNVRIRLPDGFQCVPITRRPSAVGMEPSFLLIFFARIRDSGRVSAAGGAPLYRTTNLTGEGGLRGAGLAGLVAAVPSEGDWQQQQHMSMHQLGQGG